MAKRAIYFHALQDLRVVLEAVDGEEAQDEEFQTMVRQAQACFVKDLDEYLKGFGGQHQHVLVMIQAMGHVGTSFEWQDDLELVRRLEDRFSLIDSNTIKPWVRAEK